MTDIKNSKVLSDSDNRYLRIYDSNDNLLKTKEYKTPKHYNTEIMKTYIDRCIQQNSIIIENKKKRELGKQNKEKRSLNVIEKKMLRYITRKKKREEASKIHLEKRSEMIKADIKVDTDNISTGILPKQENIRTKCAGPFKDFFICYKGENSGLKSRYPDTNIVHMSLSECIQNIEDISKHKCKQE